MSPPTASTSGVEVLAQPVHSLVSDIPIGRPLLSAEAPAPVKSAGGWRAETAKANDSMLLLLDVKAAPQDVVSLDNYVQPVDRGPATDPRLLRSWQFEVTGKATSAQVLQDLKVEHIKSGGPAGVLQKARKEIVRHGLDDTFYVVDLANVLRMYKAAMPATQSHVTCA